MDVQSIVILLVCYIYYNCTIRTVPLSQQDWLDANSSTDVSELTTLLRCESAIGRF